MQPAQTPHFGARFELVRKVVEESAAVYDAAVYLPSSVSHFALRISAVDGSPTLQPVSEAGGVDLPAWVREHLLAMARQIFRAARRDGLWGRRLNRWHEDPTQTEARGRRLQRSEPGDPPVA